MRFIALVPLVSKLREDRESHKSAPVLAVFRDLINPALSIMSVLGMLRALVREVFLILRPTLNQIYIEEALRDQKEDKFLVCEIFFSNIYL
jgi:hypothetical protein